MCASTKLSRTEEKRRKKTECSIRKKKKKKKPESIREIENPTEK
jgi:hypothetical protein